LGVSAVSQESRYHKKFNKIPRISSLSPIP
jgi:hypothetical protein